MSEYVDLTVDDHGVATIRLNRPPVNAIDPDLWDAVGEAAVTCHADDDIGAVVLWGGEKVFAAGADIKFMSELTFTEFSTIAPGIQEAFTKLARIPKVVIAAINGYALGAGCELALAADFRYAAENAKLGQPEIKLGVVPGAGGSQRLTRLVGITKAKEMIYGGDFYDAAACLEMGLVDQVHPADQVYEQAVAAARKYANGPFALRMAKQAIDQGIEMDLDNALRLETSMFTATFATEDRREGMASFLEHGPGHAKFTRK